MRLPGSVVDRAGWSGCCARARADRSDSRHKGVPPGTNPETGARPGNEVGTGMSLPMGNRASNIDQMRHSIHRSHRTCRHRRSARMPMPWTISAPRSPALQAGRTGEAQQSLEMAQTRLLDRSVPRRRPTTRATIPR